MISVYISDRATLHIVKSATMTIVDLISKIGGTLGLFCGFSILSGFEIAYWIAQVSSQKINQSPYGIKIR